MKSTRDTRITCPTCKGDAFATCRTCHGSGRVWGRAVRATEIATAMSTPTDVAGYLARQVLPAMNPTDPRAA